MQKNLKNTGGMNSKTKLLIASLFCSMISFSQTRPMELNYPVVKVINKDSVIIFTLDQGRTLAKKNETVKKLEIDARIMESQISLKDSIISFQQNQINDYRSVQIAYDVIMKEMKHQQKVCSDEREFLNKEIKRQRRHKNIAILSGVSCFGILSYFYITK